MKTNNAQNVYDGGREKFVKALDRVIENEIEKMSEKLGISTYEFYLYLQQESRRRIEEGESCPIFFK